MTPEQIEIALWADCKSLQDLAKARIALEEALSTYADALGNACNDDDYHNTLQEFDDLEGDFFTDIAGPFEVTTGCAADAEDIVKTVFKEIKARLLKPENRIKESLS